MPATNWRGVMRFSAQAVNPTNRNTVMPVKATSVIHCAVGDVNAWRANGVSWKTVCDFQNRLTSHRSAAVSSTAPTRQK